MIYKNIIALDLGTTKFCLGRISKDVYTKLPKLDYASIPAQGMRRGMLSNFEEAQSALEKLVEKAEQKFASNIDDVVVGIAGSHLESEIIKIDYFHPHPFTVTQKTLSDLECQVKQKTNTSNKEIIHIVPISYTLDDRSKTKNPVGFSFKKISAEFFIIKADRLYLLDVIKLCNHCGLRIKKLYAEPFASASIILTEDMKQHGVAIADIGGGTTDGIIFQKGEPFKVFTLNIGGKIVTNDLALGLGLSFDEAESIKQNLGLRYPTKDKTIETQNIHHNLVHIKEKFIYSILSARINELGLLIKTELFEEPLHLGGGLILTGGGSEINCLSSFLGQYLSTSVQKICPVIPSYLYKDIEHATNIYSQEKYATRYATLLGLIYLESLREENEKKPKNSNKINTVFKSFMNWLKELS